MAERIEQQIAREVAAWPGVTIERTVRRHRVSARLPRAGHLHGGRLADLPFPVRVREELVAAGRAEPHHVRPDSGWISYRIRGAGAVARP